MAKNNESLEFERMKNILNYWSLTEACKFERIKIDKDIILLDKLNSQRDTITMYSFKKVYHSIIKVKDLIVMIYEIYGLDKSSAELKIDEIDDKEYTYLSCSYFDNCDKLITTSSNSLISIFINPVFYFLNNFQGSKGSYSEQMEIFNNSYAPVNLVKYLYIPDTSSLISFAKKYMKMKTNMFEYIFPKDSVVYITPMLINELEEFKKQSNPYYKYNSFASNKILTELNDAINKKGSNFITFVHYNLHNDVIDCVKHISRENPNDYVYLYTNEPKSKKYESLIAKTNVLAVNFVSSEKEDVFYNTTIPFSKESLSRVRNDLLEYLNIERYSHLFIDEIFGKNLLLSCEDFKTLGFFESFYLESLNNPPKLNGLKYLTRNDTFVDVQQSKEYKTNINKITAFPKARWFSPYNLYFSQQNIVNQFFSSYGSNEITSANGAAGTGKTTLIKDIVAEVIYKKASRIIKDDFNIFDNGSLKNDYIGKYEIMVVSNNNFAVENISKELPKKDKQAFEYLGLDVEKDALMLEDESNKILSNSFGLISIALGKSKNISELNKFIASFNESHEELYSKALTNKDSIVSDFKNSQDAVENYIKMLSSNMGYKKYYQELKSNKNKNISNIRKLLKDYKSAKEKVKDKNAEIENYQSLYTNNIAKVLKHLKTKNTKKADEYLEKFQVLLRKMEVIEGHEEKYCETIEKIEEINKSIENITNFIVNEFNVSGETPASISKKLRDINLNITSLNEKIKDLVNYNIAKQMQINDIETILNNASFFWKLKNFLYIGKCKSELAEFKEKIAANNIIIETDKILLQAEEDKKNFFEKIRLHTTELANQKRELQQQNDLLEYYSKHKKELLKLTELIEHEYPSNGMQNLSEILKSNIEYKENLRKVNISIIKDINHFNKLHKEITKKLKEKSHSAFQIREARVSMIEADKIKTPNNEFFESSEKEIQLSSLYASEGFKKAQARLFFNSMRVHELNLILNYDKIKPLILGKQKYLDLKNSKYLSALSFMFPVVSSSLASAHRMLKHLDEVGVIISDESGQATVLSGYCFMNKTKNSMIVGDPLQIEPISEIVEPLNDILMKANDVYDDIFNITTSSVQVLSDFASKYGTMIANTRIGMPLKVHRRCISPIFDISNDISYDNQIINTTPALKEDDPLYALSESCWYHIETPSGSFNGNLSSYEKNLVDKFIEQKKLMELKDKDGESPTIYVISPFKDMRGLYSYTENYEFGTLHTFQGKEADIVFLVLGGSTNGARNWASQKANMLNVAATRAKKRFYVIGDYNNWSTLPHFNKITKHLGEHKDMNAHVSKITN